jgi:hypothetical protein
MISINRRPPYHDLGVGRQILERDIEVLAAAA